MLKVLIVDDEMLVRVGIKSTIEWEKYGCEVVDEAANGEDALRKIEVYCPDILLTDIRMPKMDGIELLREIEKRGLPIETIIMSCYNEFDLVREAMKLGASDYLLKLSFTEEELVEVIKRIRKKIEKRKVPDSKNLFSQAELRSKLFQKLTDSLTTHEQKQKLSENLELCVNFENAALMLLMTDHIYEHEKLGYSYPEKQGQNMMLNLMQEYLKSRGQGEVFCMDLEKGDFAIFLNQGLDLIETARFLKYKLNDYLKVTFSVFVFPDGTYEKCPDCISYAKEQLRTKRYFEGNGQICVYKSGEECARRKHGEEDTRLSFDIHTMAQFTNLENRIYKVVEVMKREQIPINECRRSFMECVYNVSVLLQQAGGSLKGLEEYIGWEILKSIQELESLDHIVYWFVDFKEKADQYMKECISKQKRIGIDNAMRYVHENYSVSLNLRDVAEKAGLSEAYFSTVFKKENGKSFVEYLTDFRVEKAKELLRNREICVYEIGEQVGYTDPNYFSKVFRKATGLSPEKYRRKILEELKRNTAC